MAAFSLKRLYFCCFSELYMHRHLFLLLILYLFCNQINLIDSYCSSVCIVHIIYIIYILVKVSFKDVMLWTKSLLYLLINAPSSRSKNETSLQEDLKAEMPAEHLSLSLSRLQSLHICVVGHCPMSVQSILTTYFIPSTFHNCFTAFIAENHLLVCFSKDNLFYLLLLRCPRLQRITHFRIWICLTDIIYFLILWHLPSPVFISVFSIHKHSQVGHETYTVSQFGLEDFKCTVPTEGKLTCFYMINKLFHQS